MNDLENLTADYKPKFGDVVKEMYPRFVDNTLFTVGVAAAIIASPFMAATTYRRLRGDPTALSEGAQEEAIGAAGFMVFCSQLAGAMVLTLPAFSDISNGKKLLAWASANVLSIAYEQVHSTYQSKKQEIIDKKIRVRDAVALEAKELLANYGSLKAQYGDTPEFESAFTEWYQLHSATSADPKMASVLEPIPTLEARLHEETRHETTLKHIEQILARRQLA